MEKVMTDYQLESVLRMIEMIFDGCSDLPDARKKIRKLVEDQDSKESE